MTMLFFLRPARETNGTPPPPTPSIPYSGGAFGGGGKRKARGHAVGITPTRDWRGRDKYRLTEIYTEMKKKETSKLRRKRLQRILFQMMLDEEEDEYDD